MLKVKAHNGKPMKKLAIIASTEMTISAFFINHLKSIELYYDVTVITNTDNPFFLEKYGLRSLVIAWPVVRKINIYSDLVCLFKLMQILFKMKPDLIFSVTPKAGLLTAMAGFFARVPKRVHMFTGQVWASRTGISQKILKNIDRVTAFLSTDTLADSHSQKKFLENEKIVKKGTTIVLASGSISGVDLERFQPDYESATRIRTEIGIPKNAITILYLGRLNKEKGLIELSEAFKALNDSKNEIYLLVVGPDESDLESEITTICNEYIDKVKFIGFTSQPQDYMNAADIICLPSYREGFGSVIIEAAACGKPAVVSNIYGLTDAVVNGVTGLVHESKNVSSLIESLERLIQNDEVRVAMGLAARKRAIECYGQDEVTGTFLEFIQKKLNIGNLI